MDSRRLLVHRVAHEGFSVAHAARLAGVSRETAYRWILRSQVTGVEALAEVSRRPHSSPRQTGPEVVAELLELKDRYPGFGPLKLCALMKQPLNPRTAARILSRLGRTVVRPAAPEEIVQRFERETSNELWQMDFKGLKRREHGYEILSVIDDATRYCLSLKVLPDQRLISVWQTLWTLFGEIGLPDQILSDNGTAFSGGGTWRISQLDARLIRLGIRPIHGRPYHPQTQGKVERFHGTLQRSLNAGLYAPSPQEAQQRLDNFCKEYNWERPHQSLNQMLPGSLYSRSSKRRPKDLPEPEYPSGVQTRKVDGDGHFVYKGPDHKAGRGLAHETIAIKPCSETGDLQVFFCHVKLASLEDLKVSRMSCPEVSTMS